MNATMKIDDDMWKFLKNEKRRGESMCDALRRLLDGEEKK